MSVSLERVLEEARKLSPEQRRRLAAFMLEESDDPAAARRDQRLEAMREAAGDELFLADLAAAAEDFRHADQNRRPA